MVHTQKTSLLSLFSRLLYKINHHADTSLNPYNVFGIFGLITYPLYFVIWKVTDSEGYENLWLRLVVCALCIPLIFHKKWPDKAKKFLAIFWYFTLMYSLPFLFTFLVLKNNLSYLWLLNAMTVLILSVLLLDTLTLFIILTLGVFLGWLAYSLTTTADFIIPPNFAGILITYISVIAFGALFANRKDKLQQDKYQTMKALGASIAHELRTPLASLNVAIDTLNTVFPTFIDAYQKAQTAELPVKTIKADHLKQMESKLGNMKKETRSSLTFIDMLLLNLNPQSNKSKIELFSVKKCINDTLERYPFVGNERELVKWSEKENDDFSIQGEPLLVIHVLFNLLKNAIYYVHKAGKGDIHLLTKRAGGFNILYVKDTGTGIARGILPHIFERFFSRTYHGAGVGLTFCRWVMNDLGGEITCESIEGDYTLFILRFPDKELPRE